MKELRRVIDALTRTPAPMGPEEQDERIRVLESKVEANRIALDEHMEDQRAHRKRGPVDR